MSRSMLGRSMSDVIVAHEVIHYGEQDTRFSITMTIAIAIVVAIIITLIIVTPTVSIPPIISMSIRFPALTIYTLVPSL